MEKNAAIIITGAAGFIGSCLVSFLNGQGYENLLLADDFSDERKMKNLKGKSFTAQIPRSQLFDWLNNNPGKIDFFYHIGARTDTTEFDYSIHEKLNVEYSKNAWTYCANNKVPFVYASSAATYGGGEYGYKDDHSIVPDLQPLNPYGISKNEFDKWVLDQIKNDSPGLLEPPAWAGLKFFNVYGPNEYHKERMASVIYHSFSQIKTNGFVKLFKSHKDDFKDGEQLRDFIYVKDILEICYWFFQYWSEDPSDFPSGIYNAGTGEARSFTDLVKATFAGLDLPPQIKFIDMPEDIREKYQYYTQADMQKIRKAGYVKNFYSLENGVNDYVRNYLATGAIY